MQKGFFVLLFVLSSHILLAQKITTYSSENGIVSQNNVFRLGGSLNRSTLIDGSLKSLQFTNLDTFFVDGKYVQIKNNTRKLVLSSNDSLNVLGKNISFNATQKVNIESPVKLGRYKNNVAMDSVLTVDNQGSLILVRKPITPPGYAAESGLTLEDNKLLFGGSLTKSTGIIGNNHNLRFSNLDTFLIDGKFVEIKNSTSRLLLSSNDSLNVTGQNISLQAAQRVSINGLVKFEGYKNNIAMDSVLSVDEQGHLCLVPKALGQQIAAPEYSAENGLSLENNKLLLGGSLNKSTGIVGNNHSLRFSNLDTFFLGGRHIQFLNSTKNTTISSFDSLRLQSLNSLLISANKVTVDGLINLPGYKNSANLDSVLTVDNCGNLKLVSQSSLQTVAQNAFMKNGNSFGAAAFLGTNDKNFLHFKTNNQVRGGIDTNGVFNYNFGININNSKLKTGGDIEVNGIQAYATTEYQKASSGINFVAGTEPFARGTISFNSSLASMNYTSLGAIRFFTAIGGVPYNNMGSDLYIKEGVFGFGGNHSISQADEASAAYHFKDHYDGLGSPKGILFPRVTSTTVRNYQTAPAIGLMFYNRETNDVEIYKPDGWHKFQTVKIGSPSGITTTASTTIVENVANANSFVQPIGDGQKKSFTINHNLNAQFVMVQFVDCGPEANCNVLQIIPKGARVELDGKNNAVITFEEAPSFQRYKVMFLRVQ